MLKKKMFSFFAGAMLIATLAVPAFAQSITLNANVPFDFTVADIEMPAGEYTIRSMTNNYVLAFRNEDTGTTAVGLSVVSSDPLYRRSDESKLVFHRYGDQYILAQTWDGVKGVGRALPMSRAERELAQTASAGTYEIVAISARR